jgi:pyroglutamyl-peptidase
MSEILLTGFEPFGGYRVNPTEMLLHDLAAQSWKQGTIHPVLLPVNCKRIRNILQRAIQRINPHVILSMGQADGRQGISIERVALNILDFKIRDNGGNRPHNRPVIKNSPDAYFARMPFDTLLASLRRQKIPAVLSNTAGTYCCNQAMYICLYRAQKIRHLKSCGFIHVPLLPEQVAAKQLPIPSMPYDLMLKALKTILRVLIRT